MNCISCHLLHKCSGCELDKFVILPPVWKDVTGFFGNKAPILFSGEIAPFRYRSKLAIRGSSKKPKIGLFKRGSHEVVDIDSCPLHFPLMNDLLSEIRSSITEFDIDPYQESSLKGRLKYLQMTLSRFTFQIQLVLVFNGSHLVEKEIEFLKKIYKSKLCESIWINFSPDKTNTIFGGVWQLFHGKKDFYQKILNGKFCFHPSNFSQAHLSLFEKMLLWIRMEVTEGQNVLELYSGTGSIGGSLAEKAAKVTLVESSPFSFESFTKSEFPGKDKCKFLQTKVENCDPADADLIIVDPPRKGLSVLCKNKINHSLAENLIYISCGFSSFRRDAIDLLNSGWKLKNSAGFLFFPGTNQVELAVSFFR